MKLIAIKTGKGFYVSDNLEQKEYHTSILLSNKFDTEFTKTFHKDWVFCETLPTKQFKKGKTEYVNPRWVIKSGYPISELTPHISMEEPDEDIIGLYSYKRDVIEGDDYTEEVEVEVIVEQTDFEIKQISHNVSHNLIDRITTPSILLVNKATKIGRVESFKTIRNFVKSNIDSNCAKITSDHDFHFQVNKVIKHEPEEYRRDVSSFQSKKAKYVTDYRRERQVKIIELQAVGSNYSGASLAPEFEGVNYDDCVLKLNEYLDRLKIEITTPLEECSHCKGTGIKL